MTIAAVLGLAIGIEREYRAKEAGIRTHFLVSMGSALFMIISEYGLLESGMHYDPARIAAQIVSGIGFIGAGTIMIERQTVKGLTTAAGLWSTAGIGMAIGCGMYVVGIIATILVLAGFELFNKIVYDVAHVKRTIVFECSIKDMFQRILEHGILSKRQFISYNMEEVNGKYISTIIVKIRDKEQEEKIKEFFSLFKDLTIKKIE